MNSNSQKVVFITGSSAGIGKEYAKLFFSKGHSVVLFARRKEKLEAIKQEMSPNSEERILLCPGDVTDRNNIKAAIDQTIQKFGRIDILINNAGAGLNSFIENLDEQNVRNLFDLNIMGVLYTTQEVIPWMKKQGAGQIVNITSIAGTRGLPSRSIYCASKFAVEGISQSMRLELKPYGIKTTVVRPTSTETEFFDVEPKGKEYLGDRKSMRMSAEKVARVSYNGIIRKKKYITISYHGKMAVVLNLFFPGFVDWIINVIFKHMERKKTD